MRPKSGQDCNGKDVQRPQQIIELISKETLSRGVTILVFKDSKC